MQYLEKTDKSIPYVIEVHISDLHFGAVDPYKQFCILKEQFLDKISLINFDILSIDGDIFDKKFMANSSAIYYAMEFVRICVEICASKQATMIVIGGTESHDAGQLQLFKMYEENENIDFRIIEHICFQYAKGLKILCIPEEYGKGEEYYINYLDDFYDTVFMHGTVVGSVYGATHEDLNSKKYPVFSIDSFRGCRGPIICGHVHKAMCLNKYIYYNSNPIRYRFGEEEEKGFNIVLHDLQTGWHKLEFIPIKSFRYDTINIKTLENADANYLINYFDNLLANGIDNVRIDFSDVDIPTVQKIVEQYYINRSNVSIKRYSEKNTPRVNTTEEIENKYSDLGFLLDPKLDEYTKFVNFINHNEGKQFITVEELKKVLSGGI